MRIAATICLTQVLLFSIHTELDAQDFRRRGRSQDSAGLKKGQQAPDFELQSLDGESKTRLSSLYAKKPVILFFGSYT